MFYLFTIAWLSVFILISGQPLWAQTITPSGDPLDPQAPSAKITYQSIFSEYHSWNSKSGKDWGEANDEVGRSTGHADHHMPKSEDGRLINDSPKKLQHMHPPMEHSGQPVE